MLTQLPQNRITTAWRVAGIVLAVAFLAAGCGSSKSSSPPTTTASAPVTTTTKTAPATGTSAAKAAYEKKMQKLGQGLGTILATVGNTDSNVIGGGADLKTVGGIIAQNLRQVQTALRKAAAQLAAITPPPAVKADHELLRKGALEYANELTPIIAQMHTGNVLQPLQSIPTLKGVKDMTAASQAITLKGYVITQ